MTKQQTIKLFSDSKIRTIWDSDKEKWYFSVVDVVGVLKDSDYQTARKYWKSLKSRIKKESGELVTDCYQLKMEAPDGRMRLADVADQQQLFRIIQSIPSPKAEPFKQWMAQVASNRLDQMQDPELSINQAVSDYRRLGYSEEWINQRIRTIEVRKNLTDEWQRCGVRDWQYASLTDIITQQWSGMTTRDYKGYKGLHKESLRDNMTNIELALNILAEASTTEISRQQNPRTFNDNKVVAKSGGDVAKAARLELENRLGRAVISDKKASDYLPGNIVTEVKKIDK